MNRRNAIVVFFFWAMLAGASAQTLNGVVLDPLAAADRDFQTALSNWGDGKSATTEDLLKHALALRTEVLGADSPQVAEVLERLGAIYYNRHDYGSAEIRFSEALIVFKRHLGERDINTLHTMGDLGATLREMGRYREAREIVERSVALRREILGSNDPVVAGGLNNLGRIYLAERRFADARSAFEESLRIYQAGGIAFAELANDDEALLQRTADLENGGRSLLLAVFASALTVLLSAGLMATGAIVSERAYASDPPLPPPFYGLPLLAAGQFAFYAAAIALGIGAAILLAGQLGFEQASMRLVGGGGALAALTLARTLSALATNGGRRLAGLPLEPVTLFGRRQAALEQPAAGRPAVPWFPAMEYYALAANRTFKVFVTPTALCGAKIGGLTVGDLGAQIMQPSFWTQSALARALDRLDPDSAAFAQMNRANFRVAWNEISALDYVPNKKWGMGNIPHSGRLVVHLRAGRSRELILLGYQNGKVLRDELDRARVGAVPADCASEA